MKESTYPRVTSISQASTYHSAVSAESDANIWAWITGKAEKSVPSQFRFGMMSIGSTRRSL
jgi:hypothetical protein